MAGPGGWTVGSLIGNEMDRQECDREIDESYRTDPDTYAIQERLLTINEAQMTKLIKQAVEEAATRGEFDSATFEQVGEGYVVSLNFKKVKGTEEEAEGAD